MLVCFYRLVKLSSPNLNYLIIIGAVCLYACVFIAVTPINDEAVETVICNVMNSHKIDLCHKLKLLINILRCA